MTLILSGLPMSGKTTIGKLIAEKLQLQFLDTDRMIELAYASMTGMNYSCRQIFSENGELFFRAFEKEQIKALQGDHARVIALGGGVLIDPDNVKTLQSMGRIFYLKTPAAVIWERMLKNGIPHFLDPLDPERSFYALADRRRHDYEKSAHAIIETAFLNELEIVEAIIKQKEMTNGK